MSYNKFIGALKTSHRETDLAKGIRSDNILRELRTYKCGLTENTGDRFVSITSVIRYLCHHYDDYAVCKEFVHPVQSKISNSHVVTDSGSILEVYKKVTQTPLKHTLLEKLQHDKVMLDELHISTLYHDHKVHFTEKQWWRICMFEWHFSRSYNLEGKLHDHGALVELRRKFLQDCFNIKQFSEGMQKMCKEPVLHQMKRKALAESERDVCVQISKQMHLPSMLEFSVLHEITSAFSLEISVVCLDCTEQYFQHKHGIHVFLWK